VDGVVPAAQGRQQTDGRGPVQQRDGGVAGEPGQLRHGVLAGSAGGPHDAQGVGIDRVPEQVKDRELTALVFGEGVGEPVGQGSSQ
jgi:hypothetical protein